MADENRPLLQPAAPSAPSLYASDYHNFEQGGNVSINLGSGEMPPPYVPTGNAGVAAINCKVCQAMISLEGKASQLVVKCALCHEATPIRPPPPGKKYVRCRCNCLMICKAESRRVICPRENCKQVIIMDPSVITTEPRVPGNVRVICAHCSGMFQVSLFMRALARCPHCHKVSSIGKWFARSRAFAFLIPGVLCLVFAILVTVLTQRHLSGNHGIIAAYFFAFLVASLLLLRSLYFCRIRVSHIDGPA